MCKLVFVANSAMYLSDNSCSDNYITFMHYSHR